MKSKQYSPIKEIEMVRTQMVQTAMIKGLNHPSTLKISQQLDRLLNGYNTNKSSTQIRDPFNSCLFQNKNIR